jgi:MFS family permease
MSTISRWFTRRRGIITGVTQAGAGLGGMILPTPAGWLILNYGWRTSYNIMGIIALVVVILAAQFLKRDPAQMGLVPYGEGDVRAESSDLQARGFSLQKAIHARQFWMVCVIFFCFGFTRSAILIHIVPHATDLGFSLIVGANVLAIISGVSILGRLIFGRIGDSIGNRPALIISFTLMAIILFWATIAEELWMLYLFAVIFGLGWGALAVLRISITSELFGLSSLGIILGITEMGATVGGAFGPFLAGWIFDMTDNYTSAFLVSAGVAIIGFIVTWPLRPVSVKEGMEDSNE